MRTRLGLIGPYVKMALVALSRRIGDGFRPDPAKVRRCVSCRQMFIGIEYQVGGVYACSDDCAERHWRDVITFQP